MTEVGIGMTYVECPVTLAVESTAGGVQDDGLAQCKEV